MPSCRRAWIHLIDAQGALQLSVFGADQGVLATASSDAQLLVPRCRTRPYCCRCRGAGHYAAAEPVGARLLLRVVQPLPGGAPGAARLLQALYPLPAQMQTLTSGVEQANFDFKRLKYLRDSLKLTFTLVLTFVHCCRCCSR